MENLKGKKSIIIFGATSKIAQSLIDTYLLEQDYNIYAVGRKETDFFEKRNITYIRADIREEELYNKLPRENVFAVYNFAGVQPSIMSVSEKDDHKKVMLEYIDINIKGVTNILEYCKDVKADRYIFTDSHRAYEGYWENGRFLNGDLPVKINFAGDHSMYAISKYTSVMISEYYREFFGLKTFIFRLPMIFCVPEDDMYLVNGEKKRRPYLHIIKQAMEGKPLEVWGDPMLKRDYVYITNACQILYKALITDVKHGVYNIGTGEAVTTEEFIKSIATVFSPKGQEHEILYKPEKLSYKCAIYDITKEKAELGYEPDSLIDMLKMIKMEMEENNMIDKWGWNKQ